MRPECAEGQLPNEKCGGHWLRAGWESGRLSKCAKEIYYPGALPGITATHETQRWPWPKCWATWWTIDREENEDQ
jgi:hypothetical protein